MSAKVLIALLLACLFVTSAFAAEPEGNVAPVIQDGPDRFIGIVTAIVQDPNSGAWMQIHIAFYYVMVWYNREMPSIGMRVWVLANYIDNFPYPTGRVSIYKGLSWEAIE